MAMGVGGDSEDDAWGKAVLAKVTRRLIPFLFVLYMAAFLDRANLSIAKLGMNKLVWFTDHIYGVAAGIFFIGYFLFEVPSNIILERVGARLWIARIMFTWGVIAMAMACINSAWLFYTLRFLLGIAEAGFFPGIILYLTFWYTAADRARIVGLFMTATALANAIGSPLSGALLGLHGFGLHGWQWLFIVEGLPSVLLAFAVLAYLPNGPQTATWLSQKEKDWLISRVHAEQVEKAKRHHPSMRLVFANPNVWLLCLLYSTVSMSQYGFTFWVPTIVKSLGHLQDYQVGLLVAIPYIGAAISMVLNGRHSDRVGERSLHFAVPSMVGAIGLIISAYMNSTVGMILSLTLAAFGMWAVLGPFWTLPTAFLSGTAAAAGIAFINSVGNLGGWGAGSAFEWVKEHTKDWGVGPTKDFFWTFILMAAIVLFGAALALRFRDKPERVRGGDGVSS